MATKLSRAAVCDPLPSPTAGQRAHTLLRWALLCACAECLGIAAAALWYGRVVALFGEPSALAPGLSVWLLLTLSAVPEGLALGVFRPGAFDGSSLGSRRAGGSGRQS